MPAREKPGDDRAPVVSGDVCVRPAESFDDAFDVVDEVTARVLLTSLRRVAQSVTPKIRRNGERAGLRQRVDLFRPGLSSFGEPVKQDGHLSVGRTVDHRAKAKSIRPDHMLRSSHFLWGPL